MAREELVDLLRQGSQTWNAWRAAHPAADLDLSGAALRGLDLSAADLSGVDLSGADLRGSILSGANLANARLEGANLFKTAIDGADLTAADLTGVHFLHCAQLEAATNWQSAHRDEELACGDARGSHRRFNRHEHRCTSNHR